MKKMIAIIAVLLILFIGMVIVKNNERKDQVTAGEVEEIEQYITKIYMWKEVTTQALPEFESLHEVPDRWAWEVVKKNLEDYEIAYDQIQEKAKELFGMDFQKQFPKEGTEYLRYDEQNDLYYATSIELDKQEDEFLLNEIQKTKEGYQIEIIEYLEDYSKVEQMEEGKPYDILLKNLNEEQIAILRSDENEATTIEKVKQNKDRFTKKEISIRKDENGNLQVYRVKSAS